VAFDASISAFPSNVASDPIRGSDLSARDGSRPRLASHPLTPIASRDPHAQAGPPPEKTITLASLMAPRMVRRRVASRRQSRRSPNPRHVRGSPTSFSFFLSSGREATPFFLFFLFFL
jgi:hypothetical protein